MPTIYHDGVTAPAEVPDATMPFWLAAGWTTEAPDAAADTDGSEADPEDSETGAAPAAPEKNITNKRSNK